ncbi:MAG: putative ABC exporter domain-containing protein [Clostridia bacterium]|nr:putative ABC exporter domain-containing protein [Clostridia bacterium]
MLDSFCYKITRQLKNNKILIVVMILGVILFLVNFVMNLVNFSTVEVNTVTLGFVRVITFCMFIASYFINETGYIGAFSEADVKFHLAGPYSKKFNNFLFIPSNIVMSSVYVLMLNCSFVINQSLSKALHMNGTAVFALSFIVFVASMTGGVLGNLLFPLRTENPMIGRIIRWLIILGCTAVGLWALMPAYAVSGSVKGLVRLGLVKIVDCCGQNLGLKYFPLVGGLVSIYEGIVLKSGFVLLSGIIQTVIYSFLIVLLVIKYDVDYYEAACLSSVKEKELKEALKAGVDPDYIRMTSNISVGKSTLKNGIGAGTYFFKHILEYSRKNILFFIDSYTILFRLVATACLFIVYASDIDINEQWPLFFIAGLLTNLYFGGFIYSGGLTVMEVGNPYFRLMPEETPKKLLFCVLADVPCMLFDSLVCAVVMYLFIYPYMIPSAFALFVFVLLSYDIMCEFLAIPIVRLCTMVGRGIVLSIRIIVSSILALMLFTVTVILFYIARMRLIYIMALIGGACLVFAMIVLMLSAAIIDSMEN